MSSSSRNAKRTAATMIALSAANKNLSSPGGGSSYRCQIIFDYYDECMSKSTVYGPQRCDYWHKQMASCPGYKRVPGHRNAVEESTKRLESFKKKAIAEGFPTLNDYFDHQYAKSGNSRSTAYRLYKQCMRDADITNKSECDPDDPLKYWSKLQKDH